MIKFFQKLKAKKGFTLVELIVVIAIIGVLAAILVPTMLNYVTSSRVTSVDSTAASIKNNIDTFLTNCDTAGYGMLKGTNNTAKLDINIANGQWTVTFNNAAGGVAAFKTGAGKTWNAAGSAVSADTPKAGVTNPVNLLGIELADLFPEVETGHIGAALVGGKCVAVYYTPDDTSSDSQLDAILVSTGWSSDVCSWDGSTAGVSSNGRIIGTAPKLPIG